MFHGRYVNLIDYLDVVILKYDNLTHTHISISICLWMFNMNIQPMSNENLIEVCMLVLSYSCFKQVVIVN